MTWSSLGYGAALPPWLFVPATAEAQAAALRTLIRADEVVHLVEQLDEADPAWSMGRWLRACRALGLLRYIPDPPAADVWRAPACTLSNGGGDCEDFAILAASVLRWLPHAELDVVVGLCDLEPHAWLEGCDRGGWFLLETTRGELYHRPPPRYEARRRFAV